MGFGGTCGRVSPGFLFDVIAKDYHVILALIEPQRILNLSVRECSISTESGGNVVVDISPVGA